MKVNHIVRAFQNLPHALQMIHDEMHPGAELTYAKSMLAPFEPTIESVRIPNLSPESTVAIKDY